MSSGCGQTEAAKQCSKVIFKSSKLSSATEKLWEQRKSEFKPDQNGDKLNNVFGASKAKNLTTPAKDEEQEKNGEEKTAEKPKSTNPFMIGSVGSVGSNSGFVFGAKLADRVVDSKDEKATTAAEDSSNSASTLFHVLAEKAEQTAELTGTDEKASTSEKLKESAENVEKTKKLDVPVISHPDVPVTTGEEGETNLYHGTCKLHVFDVESKTWHERGQGTIRINEKKTEDGSVEVRIVGRTTGNQRVVLNSKIWPDMLLEKPGPKRIRLSAMNPDSDIPQVFLISSTENNTDAAHRILDARLTALKAANRKRKQPEDDDGDDSAETKTSKKTTDV
uniref:RanBD1 domain-containing protein n=1 Tax=Plectus sambesii TaxID=2011161 RepID=A0A914VPG1_9BILA